MRATGPREILSNDSVRFMQQLIPSVLGHQPFLGGKVDTLDSDLLSFRSLRSYMVHRSTWNLLAYENKLVQPTALFHALVSTMTIGLISHKVGQFSSEKT